MLRFHAWRSFSRKLQRRFGSSPGSGQLTMLLFVWVNTLVSLVLFERHLLPGASVPGVGFVPLILPW